MCVFFLNCSLNFQAWPYFLLFIIVENLLLWIEKKPTVRLNDSITSLSHGLFQECGRLLILQNQPTINSLFLFTGFCSEDQRVTCTITFTKTFGFATWHGTTLQHGTWQHLGWISATTGYTELVTVFYTPSIQVS